MPKVEQMKAGARVVAAVVFAVVASVIFVLPQVTIATRHEFFDINSGRLRVKWICLGVVCSDRVEETGYSRLLQNLRVEQLPSDWRPTHSKRIGLVTRRLHQEYAKLPTEAQNFVLLLEAEDDISERKKRDLVSDFRKLVREGTLKEVHDYVSSLALTNN